jgi:hypothetical protein
MIWHLGCQAFITSLPRILYDTDVGLLLFGNDWLGNLTVALTLKLSAIFSENGSADKLTVLSEQS